MKLRKFLKEKGQTSVEYLLMLAVAVSLGLLFFKKFNKYLLENPNSYLRIQMRFYERMLDPQFNYKKFRLPR